MVDRSQGHAASTHFRLEPSLKALHFQAGEESLDQAKVGAAGQTPVALGDLIERAVPKTDRLRVSVGLVSIGLELLLGQAQQPLLTGTAASAPPGILSQVRAKQPRRFIKGLTSRNRARIFQSLSEELGNELVSALRETDPDVSLGSTVKLRRPTCSRSLPAGDPAVGSRQESCLDQLVQMEGRQQAANPEGTRGVVPGYRLGLPHDMLVQRPTDRIVQRCYRRDFVLQLSPSQI